MTEEIRDWRDTDAGKIHAKFGVPERRTLAEIDRDVELADQEMTARLGRHLTEAERDIARRAAYHHGAGFNSPTLGLQDCVNLGWGVTVESKREDAGISVRYTDSAGNLHVEGDPEVARKYDAARMTRAAYQDWAEHQNAGPSRGVAGAS